jgi:hypothetical protein
MYNHIPAIGDSIFPDGWDGFASRLSPDHLTPGYSDSSFPGCDFRLPSGKLPGVSYAVNIRITGYRERYFPAANRWGYRCRVEFVGDGTPSNYCGGWIIPA